MQDINTLNEIGHLLIRLHKLRNEINDLKHNQAVLNNRLSPLMREKRGVKKQA